MIRNSLLNYLLIACLLVLPPIIFLNCGIAHPAVLSIFVTIIGLWLTEAVPLPVTGLSVPLLAAIYGVIPASKAFDSFGSDILFLFLGCFLMGRSMEKHGFDKRLAYFLLGRCMPGTSFFSLNMIMIFTSFFLSMWISNTSATAILSAVTIGILASLDAQLPDEATRKRVSVRLLLSCAFAASIGGLATPVGSPPNLIALKFLAANGITLNFLDWMKFALPISFMMLVLMFVIFEFCFPLKGLTFPGIKEKFRGLLSDLGPMRRGEKQIAIIFLLAIVFWVFPGILKSMYPGSPFFLALDSRLSMSVVGLLGGVATFYLPVPEKDGVGSNLSWNETEKLEWGTLMLFGGGLTLGLLLDQSGAAKDLSAILFGGTYFTPLVIGCLMVVTSIAMSEFASNTAAASILIPLIIGATQARGLSDYVTTLVVLAVTFGASFGFMLPVSTPPNAIVYGTGRVPARDMLRAGIFFDVAGALLIIGYMLMLRKLAG
jgi:sodium-dependent dicarboxylate transporter 2/3/5